MDPRIHRKGRNSKERNYKLLNLNMQDLCKQYFQPVVLVYTQTMHEEVFSLSVNELLVSP